MWSGRTQPAPVGLDPPLPEPQGLSFPVPWMLHFLFIPDERSAVAPRSGSRGMRTVSRKRQPRGVVRNFHLPLAARSVQAHPSAAATARAEGGRVASMLPLLPPRPVKDDSL